MAKTHVRQHIFFVLLPEKPCKGILLIVLVSVMIINIFINMYLSDLVIFYLTTGITSLASHAAQ